eukprot:scaffold408294_cov18-Prasinocladus_malaysianus.AAC.1
MLQMACPPWMPRAFTTVSSSFPDVRRLRLDFITGKPQLADEDTQSYFDDVQQRRTALEAAGLTFSVTKHIRSFLGG